MPVRGQRYVALGGAQHKIATSGGSQYIGDNTRVDMAVQASGVWVGGLHLRRREAASSCVPAKAVFIHSCAFSRRVWQTSV